MSHLQELLQTALISTKHIEGAAIISEKDSTIKSSTKNFNLTNEDCLNCVEAFKNPPQIREDGFEFHGWHFCFILRRNFLLKLFHLTIVVWIVLFYILKGKDFQ